MTIEENTQMDKVSAERRESKRALFTVENGIIASFTLPGNKIKPMTAYILNLSQGGIFFTMRTDEREKIKKGNLLLFLEIKKRNAKPFILNAEAEVVWLTEGSSREYIGIGCKFLDISKTSQQQIQRFIDLWHESSGK